MPVLGQSYTWDYWPRDDSRSPCGYVGLVNLGATCYMATAMQQLFAIREARDCILRSRPVLDDENSIPVDLKDADYKDM